MYKFIFSTVFFFFSFTNVFSQSEPSAQATNINFVGIKAYGVSVSFSGSDAEKYLVLRGTSPITGVPVDGTTYVKGEWIGNGKVLANGVNSFYTFREAVANTKYYFSIFAYNDGAVPNYLTSLPLTGNVFTSGKDLDGYYDNYRIDTDNAIDDLTDLLKSHTDLSYGSYRDLVENVLQKDTFTGIGTNIENRKYIIGEYSNIIHIYEDDISFSDYNREHVMARSWMPSNPPGDNDIQLQTSDFHNLFLVKASVNQSLRSNLPFDEVNNSGNTEMDCKNGTNAEGNTAFEPKQSIKGNIARTLFYMSVTYNSTSISWAFNDLLSDGSIQNVDTLLSWHKQDPIDDFEIARNEFIYSKQSNRNPFVDFPEWVSCIDFKTLSLNGTCPLDTAQNIPDAIQTLFESNNVIVYPNPVKEKAYLKLAEGEEIVSLNIKAMNGQVVNFDAVIDENIADLNLVNLIDGVYILKIQTKENIHIKKLLLTK